MLEKFSNKILHFHCQRSNTCLSFVVLLVIIFGIILIAVNVYQLQCIKTDHESKYIRSMLQEAEGSRRKDATRFSPIVWIHCSSTKSSSNGPSGFLKHVYLVFKKMGFSFGEEHSDWVVAWIHDYPFVKYSDIMRNLKPYQKVNHFPGSGYLTNKVSLAQTSFDFIPKAFVLPEKKKQFLEYAEKHKNASWVQKSNQHRGIQVKSVENVDLTKQGTFVQEFISRPFLIDGRKFDIGIYTIITSIDPLRVYFIDGDALFRFCPDEYYPFYSYNVDKYVIGDDYMPMWQVPSLKDLYEEKRFSFKNIFNEYLSSIGKDYTALWKKLKSAINSVILNKEPDLIRSLQKFQSKRNFFELVRFDFVLDENLDVFLMECNMSPNLSSDHFPQNARLYEHVLFNLLSLVGVRHFASTSNVKEFAYEDEMLVSSQDIQVFPDFCKGNFCSSSCHTFVCQLCKQCIHEDQEVDLKIAYLEHMHRGSAHRIFPPSVSHEDALAWSPGFALPGPKSLNSRNRLIYLWFIGKCRLDPSWCH